jgi:hypothetical protein
MFAKLLIVPLFIASGVVAVPAIARRGDVSLSDWPSQNLEVGCDTWELVQTQNSAIVS